MVHHLLVFMLAAGALLSGYPAAAQESSSAAQSMALARRASAAGEPTEALRHMEAAALLAPNHPFVQYELAISHAAVGDSAAAFATLARLAELGSSRDPRADSAFARWHGSGALEHAAARLREGAAQRVRSTLWAELPDPDLVPESIAYDPADGSLYVGSMGKQKILRRRADGSVEDFVAAGADGLGEVIGIRVDPRRRQLWVNSFRRDPSAPGWQGRPGGWAAVHRYDLETGKLVARHEPDRETPHLFNDLVLSADGEAFITDSHGGAVYRVSADGALERWFTGGPHFLYPNGIALSADGRRLYVAHAQGIITWSLPARQPEPLMTAAGVHDGWIDGLYLHSGELIAIQAADGYQQVAALRLSPDGRRANSARVLERRHPDHDAPTTGVLVGDTLLYIANSQLPRLAADGSVTPKPGAALTRILSLPLHQRR